MISRWNLGAFAIILDDDRRVLLCHRCDLDLWNLPGGGVESRETPWDAVIREVREETTLVVAIERLAGVYSKPDQAELVFSYVCTILAGIPTLTDEADQIAYFALGEIPTNTSIKQVERIHDALGADSRPRLKVQLGPSSRDRAEDGAATPQEPRASGG
jgi:8-oxo-dGTP diphosphatase